ncbi:hypothetical protein EYF80_027025 [Liparis tanakae]|uniref:Uncharacterized protein n=1 Tax=Liparis tanakae TaxID=230148 RepID=A0A4Z2HAG0_9TELE|nr:hypothetical protein EYF80_027025 [Liparis tanakae]
MALAAPVRAEDQEDCFKVTEVRSHRDAVPSNASAEAKWRARLGLGLGPRSEPLTREQISCRLVAMALAGVSQRNT